MGQKTTEPGEISVQFGKVVAHAMIDAGITTNTQLAEMTGISGPTIGRILRGTRVTPVEEAVLIAKALGIPLSKLIAAMERRLTS
ncbi:helix-turn-helix domain-containing protein [Rhodococcus sp. JVH1]|uniref:helix-turn-helix domain-containing protein n=1 Tax=Rhodococcus sp. JVH1 TaxID=745408 RepID=UPI000271EA34|nr:helix-turn-helix transcriptional regulator [Rhodococcus sp. JVH1]EJI98634.1 helix-turn-helix family protein [Rhodococcus sp. JVH1]